jgi:Domain of unknown function (DUF4124)
MNAFVPNRFLLRTFCRAGQLAIVTVGLSVLAGPLDAATKRAPKAPTESVYRCRDANGQSHFGQSIPSVCMDKDIEVLDQTGRVVRTIPGRQSLEVVAQQKAAEEAKAAAAQRDRTLLATYLTVADIERLRDQRLELLVQQNVVTRQYITNLRARQVRLMESAQRFRPYSTKQNAPPLPDQVAAEIINTVKGLQVYEGELNKNTAERAKLTEEFGADIARFKELKGT